MKLSKYQDRDKLIDHIEESGYGLPELKVEEEIHEGLYKRSVCIEAGTFIVGAIHKKGTYSILLTGSMLLFDSISGETLVESPCIVKTSPDTSRSALILEDCEFVNITRCETTLLEEVEEEMYHEEDLNRGLLKDVRKSMGLLGELKW